jgi:hypothetical protein
MHDLGVKLDFQEKTIPIDAALLPMRITAHLQLKPSITRALREKPALLKGQLAPAAPPRA